MTSREAIKLTTQRDPVSPLSDHLALVPLPRLQPFQPSLDLFSDRLPKGLVVLLATLDLFDRVLVPQPGGFELGGDRVGGLGQRDRVLGFDLVELHSVERGEVEMDVSFGPRRHPVKGGSIQGLTGVLRLERPKRRRAPQSGRERTS
jgi:hypothetical protein